MEAAGRRKDLPKVTSKWETEPIAVERLRKVPLDRIPPCHCAGTEGIWDSWAQGASGVTPGLWGQGQWFLVSGALNFLSTLWESWQTWRVVLGDLPPIIGILLQWLSSSPDPCL